jgi:hypothetical protein
MTFVDFIKATLVCGGGSFLVYTFPLVGQVLLIGLLGVLWLFYAQQTMHHLRRSRD